jgi:LIVCS family branched-chain amino acid:cation transporter
MGLVAEFAVDYSHSHRSVLKFIMCKLIAVCALVLFGMFFGAGNLVFSLKIGQATEGSWLYGFSGLISSDVVLSFFGLFFVLKRHGGSSASFFGEAGPLARAVVPFLALSLLGPFGVTPRCITVAFGGVRQLFPGVPLWAFSALFCAAAHFIGANGQRIVNVIGKIMTPILLCSIISLFALGVLHSGKLKTPLSPVQAFGEGFITGYQTMDLLLAFFSATLIFSQIRQILPRETPSENVREIAVKSSILASILLAIIYFCMVFLGSHFARLLVNTQPSAILVTITNHIAGEHAAWFIAVIMALSCFTSAAPLNAMYAQHLNSLINSKKFGFNALLLVTTLTSFAISLFDFGGIIKFLSPTLDALYPSIVSLTIAGIFFKKCYALKKILFYGILAAVLLHKVAAIFLQR